MIKNIEVDTHNTFILLENGDLWGCGTNSHGELGFGHKKQISTFVKISENVEKIKRYSHGVFLFKKDRTLWFAGNGFYLNKRKDIISFIKITDNIKDIYLELSKEKKFLFCLKNNGNLVDLIGHKINLSDVEKGIKGYKEEKPCLFIIKNDNSLFYFKKEEGLKKVESFNEVKNVFSDWKVPIFVQKIDDSLWKIEENSFKKGVKIFDDIKEVKTFNDKSFFLKKNGDLFVLGENYYGELGIDLKKTDVPMLVNSNVKEVYPAPSYTIVLKDDNSLWGCGKDLYDVLGNKSKDHNPYSFKKICDDVKKTYADMYFLFVIKQNDELWGSGKAVEHFQGDDYLKFIFNNVKNVFFDSNSFFIHRKDNTLLCFGDNRYGQLGIDSKEIWIKKPVEYTTIKKYYDVKETVKVINDVFKGEIL